MIWACLSVWFSVCVRSSVALVSGNKNGEKYTQSLERNLLLIVKEHHSDVYIFMQYGAPYHSATMTNCWYQHLIMEVLK